MVAVNQDTLELSVVAEANIVRAYTVGRALHPTASVNDAIVVRVGNLSPTTALEDYLITEIRPAMYAGRQTSTDEHPNWGHVDYSLTGEWPLWWPKKEDLEAAERQEEEQKRQGTHVPRESRW